jgi:CubicO group peptidase (beta-lactamase class C family)
MQEKRPADAAGRAEGLVVDGAGIYGQVIMVNRAEHLVIVQWSTWPQAESFFKPLEAALMYSAIARELR